MSYFVGAYASSPTGELWNPELESEYYAKLKTLQNIKGLEHPFLGTLHPHDDAWFLNNIDPSWNFVFTCIPGTMNELGKNPDFGLASDNESGRLAALAFLEKAKQAIKQLNVHLGRQAVSAIQIHSAPNQSKANSSLSSFQESLITLLDWDWDGAKVVVEHCDTLLNSQTAAKGFLTIEDEITAIKGANRSSKLTAGMMINWGRSVIEARDVAGAIHHINQAQDNDLLYGIMFSGVSDKATEYGAWQDTHMPPTPLNPTSKGEPDSLMNAAAIHHCLEVSRAKENPEFIIGAKLGIRPSTATTEDRIAYNINALSIFDAFLSN
ncbi:DUF4862 family protein [Marinomonas sp. 15G1-11]|uniref:DUF4862 family protein n=1 Tax=Marinomonas phaeophyticola TaxID=3004091 RepID=A0ABT4JRZ8_9GAMM|nr:DUF4862 family protein [Marinomonas sp. 15G1-11]MCZ2721020.1 DUF4862 family protein [Marinomonas sp. 15G1-11]